MDNYFNYLALTMGWILAVIVAGFGIVILRKVFKNEINLERLISDENGHASLSRFQFLIFTFVIALSLFLVTVANKDFPTVETGVFILLGISGGSYVTSKGIQSGRDTALEKKKKNTNT